MQGAVNTYAEANEVFWSLKRKNICGIKWLVLKNLIFHENFCYLSSQNTIPMFSFIKITSNVKNCSNVIKNQNFFLSPKNILERFSYNLSIPAYVATV